MDLNVKPVKAKIPKQPTWLMIVGLVAFFVLALLMNRLSRQANLEKHFNKRIIRRGISVGLVLLLTIIIVLSSWALEYNRQKSLENYQRELETILNTTTERLNIWVETRQKFLAALAQNTEFIAITEHLLSVPSDPETLI